MMDKFRFEPMAIPGVIKIIPHKAGDHRGYFMEAYAARTYQANGVTACFVQDNQSLSGPQGVIRGLHFQAPPSAQAKLVRVLAGSIFDVAVDIRKGSPHYGRWCATTLTAEGAEQMYVPRGFAHGFCTLEADTIVTYKVDDYYDPAAESGVFWNSPALGIDWRLGDTRPIISDKDRNLPDFSDFQSPFTYGET